MNKRIKKGLSALPALVMMIIIFLFSSKTAVQSSSTSDPITEWVLRIYESIAGAYPEDIKLEKLSFFSMLVRKAAHLGVYAFLSFTLGFHLYISKLRSKKILVFSILISFIYACTDEFHQYFIEGRACRIFDVLIDTIGASIGALFFIALTALILKIMKHE